MEGEGRNKGNDPTRNNQSNLEGRISYGPIDWDTSAG
jgi:hypothetical protein